MQTNTKYFIPVFTSKAGMCLTLENWEMIGVKIASFYLDTLLVKPGISVLLSGISLKNYWGWNHKSVLNASRLTTNKEGMYLIHSPFDGRKISICESELSTVIEFLNPDYIVLPKNHSLEIPENIRTLSPINLSEVDTAGIPEGIALIHDEELFIETDFPAQEAIEGNIFTQKGMINLLDKTMVHQQEVIDKDCHCPTCAQNLTKAYLHHLLLHTPLLCQRFLIHHNVHYYKQLLQAA